MNASTSPDLRRVAHVVTVLLMLLVAACASPRLKPDAALMSAQEQRERTLANQAAWTLVGRLAISGKGDGGSGSLEWTQDGRGYRFNVQAPVTGKTWTLTGNDQRVELEGLRAQTIVDHDAASLLERELGWQVPIEQLAYWVRGARAPGDARIVFGGAGLPRELAQAGWKVEYLDYDTGVEPPLPRRIFASRGDSKVRLAVQRWSSP